jgi:predicted alpha/beta superfamily hydrolase
MKKNGSTHTQIIRVLYPGAEGRIVIRTDRDWERDLEPDVVRLEDGVWEFAVETAQPFFYFKPLLIRNSAVEWSRGENYLAIATSGAPLEIHPYFLDDGHCSVCELMRPLVSRAGMEHRFRVFLPPGYHENTLKRYPVLYMHDGNNLFLKEEAFLGNTWKTDEVLGVLNRMNAIKEAIVVGIHPNEREREYTQPGYHDYGRFLVETLKPLIDTRYRTLAGPMDTAAMGSSLGGVVSFYLGWEWPEVFGKVACLSSTFTYRDDFLERIATEPKRNLRIYLDSGWPRDNYEPTRSMRDRLIWKGYRPGSDLFYLAFPNAVHNETAWAERSPIPFQFLFGNEPSFPSGEG